MITATQLKPSKTSISRPAPNHDFCHVTECLTAGEINVLKRVRSVVKTKVAPVITDFGARDPFLFELVAGNNHGP
jgi:hypothetical protein